MITIPIEIGDVILTGKFRNHKVVVKELGYDEHGLPTVNGKSIMKIRVQKTTPNKDEQMIKEAPASNDPKVQRIVDELNKLIASAVDSDGDKIGVVDTSGTWQEPYEYEPIQYKNGALKITSKSQYNNKPEVEVILKRHMSEDGIPTLRNIMKMYKKAISKSGKSVNENSKSTQKWADFYRSATDTSGYDPNFDKMIKNLFKGSFPPDVSAYIDSVKKRPDGEKKFIEYMTKQRPAGKYYMVSRKSDYDRSEPHTPYKTENRVTSKIKLSEVISKGVFINIKKEDGKFWFYIDTVDGPECISNVGFPTKEAAEHAALTKGFNVVKGGEAEDELPDTVEVPKPTKREKTPGTEKPKEIDLGKEKEIKLEESLKRIIRNEIRRVTESANPSKYIDYIKGVDLYGWDDVFDVLVQAGFDTMSYRTSSVPTEGSPTINLKKQKPTFRDNVEVKSVKVDKNGNIVVKTNVAYLVFWDNNMKESFKKKRKI